MILNLEEGTVTFTFTETLNVDQIYALLDLMQVDVDDDGPCHLEICQDCRERDGWVYPESLHFVRSDSSMKIYRVAHMEDDTWACSCPDWIYRKSKVNERCKHIYRVILFGA